MVADFGVARAISAAGEDRLTETGLALGPRDLDGRSDLYVLGCVVYEMLAGQPPFLGLGLKEDAPLSIPVVLNRRKGEGHEACP